MYTQSTPYVHRVYLSLSLCSLRIMRYTVHAYIFLYTYCTQQSTHNIELALCSVLLTTLLLCLSYMLLHATFYSISVPLTATAGAERIICSHTQSAASNTPREVLLGSATHTERERVTNTHI